MKRKKLTKPQLYLLRRIVSEGFTHIYGSSTVRVAHTLEKLGLIKFIPPDGDDLALSTPLGREAVAHNGRLN